MMRTRLTGFALVQAVSGLGVWALCFVVLYGGLSIGCQRGWAQHTVGPFNLLSVALVVAWAIHAVVLGVMLTRAWRRARSDGTDAGVGPSAEASVGAEPGAEASHRAPGQHERVNRCRAAANDGGTFVRWLTLALHGMSAVALVALGAPLLLLAPCV